MAVSDGFKEKMNLYEKRCWLASAPARATRKANSHCAASLAAWMMERAAIESFKIIITKKKRKCEWVSVG
ncbi:MAG TPA: hypothetical protein PKN04_11225 [bacterium]|nr:hypothetical protein [bacterium]